jgi:hypothetical protein
MLGRINKIALIPHNTTKHQKKIIVCYTKELANFTGMEFHANGELPPEDGYHTPTEDSILVVPDRTYGRHAGKIHGHLAR